MSDELHRFSKFLKWVFTSSDPPLGLLGVECWELSSPKEFPLLFRNLVGFFPDGCMLIFEEGTPDGELKEFLESNRLGQTSSQCDPNRLACTVDNLTQLADLAENYAEPEVAIHFHVECDGEPLLNWYDVPTDPIYLSDAVPEDKVQELCRRLSVDHKRYVP